MEFKDLLYEEIADEFKQLKGIDVGTDEYKVTVDGLTKLMDRSIEIEKLEYGHVEKQNQAENEKIKAEAEKLKAEAERLKEEADEKFRNEQAKRDERNRWIQDGIAVAGIITNVGLVIWGTVKSFEFEREGTITTIMGRGFINKLLPKK